MNCSYYVRIFTEGFRKKNTNRIQILQVDDFNKLSLNDLDEFYVVTNDIPILYPISYTDFKSGIFHVPFYIDQEIKEEIFKSYNFEETENSIGRLKLEINKKSKFSQIGGVSRIIYIGFSLSNSGRYYRSRNGIFIGSERRVSLQKKISMSEYIEIAFCQKRVFTNLLSNRFIWKYMLKNEGKCNFFSKKLVRLDSCPDEVIEDDFKKVVDDCNYELSRFK